MVFQLEKMFKLSRYTHWQPIDQFRPPHVGVCVRVYTVAKRAVGILQSTVQLCAAIAASVQNRVQVHDTVAGLQLDRDAAVHRLVFASG